MCRDRHLVDDRSAAHLGVSGDPDPGDLGATPIARGRPRLGRGPGLRCAAGMINQRLNARSLKTTPLGLWSGANPGEVVPYRRSYGLTLRPIGHFSLIPLKRGQRVLAFCWTDGHKGEQRHPPTERSSWTSDQPGDDLASWWTKEGWSSWEGRSALDMRRSRMATARSLLEPAGMLPGSCCCSRLRLRCMGTVIAREHVHGHRCGC